MASATPDDARLFDPPPTTASTQPAAKTKQAANKSPSPRTAQSQTPSKKHIYARPLPLQTHPLPALIPHNPLTLLRIAYVLLCESLAPPSSHPRADESSSGGVSTRNTSSAAAEAAGAASNAAAAVLGPQQHGTYTAYYDAATRGVHVTDEAAARALWEQGFFGKGSLSRSEPEWVEREERRRRERQKEKARVKKEEAERRERGEGSVDIENVEDKMGNGHATGATSSFWDVQREAQAKAREQTSGEVTNRRREERREEKRQRAKREAEALEEQLRAEGQLTNPVIDNLKKHDTPSSRSSSFGSGDAIEIVSCLKKSPTPSRNNSIDDGEAVVEVLSSASGHAPFPNGHAPDSSSRRPSRLKMVRFDSQTETIPQLVPAVPAESWEVAPKIPRNAPLLHRVLLPPSTHPPSVPDPDILLNQEHLQLTPAEAFFLAYGLGILTVVDPITNQPLSIPELLVLFRRTSYFPPLPARRMSVDNVSPPLSNSNTQPDDPFLLSYVVYHHFRSLGWVVRPGVKFAVDLLLYNRGPVFSHAEFAVLVIPSYSHPYWTRDDEDRRRRVEDKQRKRDWYWLHCANRVQSHVRKSLVLAYVDVPPPSPLAENGGKADVGALLRGYKVREFVIGRWSMNRNRD